MFEYSLHKFVMSVARETPKAVPSQKRIVDQQKLQQEKVRNKTNAKQTPIIILNKANQKTQNSSRWQQATKVLNAAFW